MCDLDCLSKIWSQFVNSTLNVGLMFEVLFWEVEKAASDI